MFLLRQSSPRDFDSFQTHAHTRHKGPWAIAWAHSAQAICNVLYLISIWAQGSFWVIFRDLLEYSFRPVFATGLAGIKAAGMAILMDMYGLRQ